MANVTIYIPKDLEARLETAKANGVKIETSQICQKALKKALDNMDAIDQEKTGE